jgi:hypothetical protein
MSIHEYCHAFLLSTAGVDGLFPPIQNSGIQHESMKILKAANTVF